MKKFIAMAVVAGLLTGCGWFDRGVATMTGEARSCVKGESGKSYSVIQMTSGAFYEMQQTPNGPALVECK